MGMNPAMAQRIVSGGGLPRAHGDESKDVQMAKRYVEVCPVHTGMNRHLFLRRGRGRYLPRIYGDTLAAKRNTAAWAAQKISMTCATKSVAPKLPYLEQDSPHRGRSSVLFLWFFTKKCYPQKNPLQTGAILMIY